MTDEQIVKADIIEILNNADGMEHIAIYCANDKDENETIVKVTDIINLLNSQKVKIERLNLENLQMVASIKNLKSEAIKEYREKVKAILMDKGIYPVVVKNALNEAEGNGG
jgi:predicted AAA+ superfamily ATPase